MLTSNENKTAQPIPASVQALVDAHRLLLRERLPGRLSGYCLFGSVSQGAFTEGLSDVDFMVVLTGGWDEAVITCLRRIHREIRKRHKTDLMGFYVNATELGDANLAQVECPSFLHGKFKGQTILSRNSVDAFQIRKYGIFLEGGPSLLPESPVDWDLLLQGMKHNLNTYWVKWTNASRNPFSIKYYGLLFDMKCVEWGVLGISRLYYTFRERDVASKADAGAYALAHLPEWEHILREAMRLRRNERKTVYRSLFARRHDALQFMTFMIGMCNRL